MHAAAKKKKKKKNSPWVAEQFKDPEFVKEYEHISFVQDFLLYIHEEMQRQKVTRAELAKRLGCTQANITQIFGSDNLTARTITSMSFQLGLTPSIVLRKRV